MDMLSGLLPLRVVSVLGRRRPRADRGEIQPAGIGMGAGRLRLVPGEVNRYEAHVLRKRVHIPLLAHRSDESRGGLQNTRQGNRMSVLLLLLLRRGGRAGCANTQGRAGLPA